MPLAQEFVRFVNLSYDDKNALVEKMAMDRSSVVYGQLRTALASKLALMKKSNDDAARYNGRRRLVISQTMEPEQSHNIMKEFSEFDFSFKGTERIEGGYASAVHQITVEKLFNFTRGKWQKIVAFGFSVNHLVIHNRTYTHLCVPHESIECMKRTVRDDRAMCAILSAGNDKGKPFPLMSRYATAELGDMVCGDPTTCRVEGKIGVALLTNVDTNFLQLCSWMMAHSTSVLYFAFPCSKATELRYNAPFPELDAHVKHEGNNFHILYKNATSMAQTYNYYNHLTLIGKTYERIGSYTFSKEFLVHQLGMSFYKITRAKTEDAGKDMIYRSWMTRGYKSRYLVRSFDLKSSLHDPYKPSSYKPYSFEVDAIHIDKLIQDGMRLPDDSFDHMAIAKRLRTYATTHVQAGYSIVSCGFIFDVKQFDHIVLLVYVHCFMQRFIQGVTAAYVAGDTRKLSKISQSSMVGIVPVVMRTVIVDRLSLGLSRVKSLLISLYDRFYLSRVPIPNFDMAIDFVEYRDTLKPVKWNDVGTWSKLFARPWSNFSPYLPGFDVAIAFDGYVGSMHQYNQWGLRELRAIIEYKLVGGTRPPIALASSALSLTSFKSNSDWRAKPVTAVSEVHAGRGTDSDILIRLDNLCTSDNGLLMTTESIDRLPASTEQSAIDLGNKVAADGEGLMDLRSQEYHRSVPLDNPDDFNDAHNGIDPDPLNTLRVALGQIFPGSTLMQTQDAANDILNSDFHMVARAARIKITTAKLQPGKVDAIYRPHMPNQLLPNAKQNMQSTLHTVAKRNLNSLSSVDPLDVDELWSRTWGFMKKVYYVPDIEKRLVEMDFIGPTVEAAVVWASKLDEAHRSNAMAADYAIQTLDGVMQDSNLMLKAKRKPNLGPSYDDSVKASQSIQYDKTQTRTGVFSPIFAEKVRRDQSLLRDVVFIMQSKSPEDLNKFLHRFSWKPNASGSLTYIMLDAEMFDKSQILSTLMMHWKKCEKLKVFPSYIELLRQNTAQRSASSVAAGVKVYLTPQRGSGDSDTLDGNCDVSQAAYARFFASIERQIEFILIMGDDVTVAVRGDVDTTTVANDVMKEFNLSTKLFKSPYGEFVSGKTVHFPDGTIGWVTDPVKRAVALGEQSVSEQTDFREKWIGYADLCRGLEGYATQMYLSESMSHQYTREFGHYVSPTLILSVIKAVVSVAADYDKFRSFYSSSVSRRY